MMIVQSSFVLPLNVINRPQKHKVELSLHFGQLNILLVSFPTRAVIQMTNRVVDGTVGLVHS